MGVRKIAEVRTMANLIHDPGLRSMLVNFGHTAEDVIRAARRGELTELDGVGEKRAEQIGAAVKAAGYLHEESAESLAMRQFLAKVDWHGYGRRWLSDEEYEARVAFTPEQIEKALAVLYENLPDREAKILILRFGLDGKGQRSSETCGLQFEVTGARILQLEAKAMRNMKHPMRRRQLAEIFPGVLEVPQTAMPLSSVEEADCSTGSDDEVPIEAVDFSVRAYNCLHRAGYRTVEDLQSSTRSLLLNIPNLGSRTADEVVEKLKNLGIELDD